jgi:NAD(P)-dependent dehydrogenase (short-subunit alcohol dehydrogenase family)
MKDKVIVATGVTSGIGASAVETLARQGARIVFIARDEKRAKATLDRLRAAAPGREHRAYFADLSSIAETKKVGAEIAAAEPRVDVLVNNAGALIPERRISVEGLEMTFALNHMSYFTLTKVLLETLKASGPARIVSTASRAHFRAQFDIDDLQSRKGYSPMRVYGASKLCNILFTRELARRLSGTGVTANCFHPGVVATGFGADAGGLIGFALKLARPLLLTPEKGADTLVWLATSPEAAGISGEYFALHKPAGRTAEASDDALAAKLWTASEAFYAEH